MATKQTRSKIDPTKFADIRYLYDYFVSNNRTKKSHESTSEIYRKIASILHVGKTAVIECVKSESFEQRSSKSNIYKPTKIYEFSQEVIRRKNLSII